jgi:hypothetical protein
VPLPRLRFAAILLGGLCCPPWPATVHAAQPKPSEYSAYEQETLDAALAELGGTLDPAPEGKRIEAIDIQVLDIIEERDPAPDFLNWFHTNTQKEVVARELLVRPGERYRQSLVEESQRNLRGLRQHSLVLCRALRGQQPDGVRLLVVVKDVWSLRLNSSFRFKGGQLEYLLLQPSEENLAGTHRRIAVNFVYQPDVVALGGRFVEPRLGDSRYVLVGDANAIVNHSTGAAEGSYGFLQYGLPLYSTQQDWSWGTVFEWRREVTRHFSGLELKTYDAPSTPWDDAIPYLYRSSVLHGRISVTRAFGRHTKQELQLGMEAAQDQYSPEDLAAFAPVAAAEFVRKKLPVSDTRFGPYAQYHLYQNSFARVLDVETLGLQEDYLLGPELYLRLYPTPTWLGSSRNVLASYAEAAYSAELGDGLLRGYLAATAEIDTSAGRVSDAEIHTGLRIVSPRLGIGRLVYDGTFLHRPFNYLNRTVSLGGGDRLRGYPSGQFIGKDLIASNVELRTRSLQLWTVQLGGTLFYDVGHAFDGMSGLRPQQGAGFGLRLVFPQLERAVTRIDWGFPLTPHAYRGAIVDGLVVTFQQAFGMPRLTGRVVDLTGSP